MAVDEILLWCGIQANEAIASFGVISVDVREDHPLSVRLGVVADEERRYTLRPGDTFPVRDQVWRLDRVDDADSSDWTVVLRRVE